MQAPRFKWEWNLNTIVHLLFFAGMLVGWGWIYAELRNDDKANRASIENVDKRLSVVEADTRRLDTQELRLAAVEKQSADASTAMRAVETTLSGLSSDIRVVREILQRLEANGR